MILESLHNHYLTEVRRENPLYPLRGMESKRIHYILVISSDGQLLDVEEPEGAMNVIRSRSRGGKEAFTTPNYMWDSLGYVTGFGELELQFASFKEMVRDAAERYPTNRTFAAVREFYYRGVEQLHLHPMWHAISSKRGHNITFRLHDEELTAAQQSELIQAVKGRRAQCLVSGDEQVTAQLHPKLYISGAAGTGAKLVSFAKGAGYDSFNKRGGENAPISQDVAEGYASAITAMRQIDSGYNVVIGDVTLLCFCDGESDFNKIFCSLFKRHSADLSQYSDCAEILNIIALTPNAARISPRAHLRVPICEVVKNLELLYSYLSEGVALVQPLLLVAPYGESSRLSPQFIVEYIKSIVTASPMHHQMLQLLLKPKAYNSVIIDMLRYFLTETLKSFTPMALDRDYTNTGYLLGRMLAIVERAQKASQPNLTFTVKDSMYTTLSITPAALFNRVFSLSNTYFRRIPTPGTQVYLKTILGEVTDKLTLNGVPMRLSLEDQGRFALGYQHQFQSFYTKQEGDKDE